MKCAKCAIDESRVSWYARRLGGRTMNERMTNDERTSGAGITGELRECIRTANRSYEDARNPYNDREILHIPEEELLAIADRIDVEHDRALVKAIAEAQAEEAELCQAEVAHGWVKLPVDADGVPIHVGDEVEFFNGNHDRVRLLALTKNGWSVNHLEWNPASLHHVQPDSWVRIIGDAMSFEGDGWYSTRDDAMAELVERCRRLAGGGA